MGCQVPISPTEPAVFSGGQHDKPDCIVARSGRCEIWEFKPDSPKGRRQGPEQLAVYREYVPRYYTERHRKKEAPDSRHGGQAFLDELRKYCLDKDDDEIVFTGGDVKYYQMCEKQYVCEN